MCPQREQAKKELDAGLLPAYSQSIPYRARETGLSPGPGPRTLTELRRNSSSHGHFTIPMQWLKDLIAEDQHFQDPGPQGNRRKAGLTHLDMGHHCKRHFAGQRPHIHGRHAGVRGQCSAASSAWHLHRRTQCRHSSSSTLPTCHQLDENTHVLRYYLRVTRSWSGHG